MCPYCGSEEGYEVQQRAVGAVVHAELRHHLGAEDLVVRHPCGRQESPNRKGESATAGRSDYRAASPAAQPTQVEAEAGEDDQEGQGALQHRPLLLRVQQGVLVHGRHGEQVHHLEPERESESERE